MLGRLVKRQLDRIRKRGEARRRNPSIAGGTRQARREPLHRERVGRRGRCAILIDTMLPGSSREFLMQMMEATAIQRVAVTMAAERLRCAS